jgi:PTH1 family peptidyl-tRNA hydrolase
LKSIVESLAGATGFPRLRLGVGSAPPGMALEDWVLAPFEGEDRRDLGAFVARAADAVERILAQGVDQALPGINAPAP